MRDLRDLCPCRSGSRRGGDEGVLPGVTSDDPPGPREPAVQSDFKSIAASSAGLNDAGRIVGICRSCICAIQTINRRCDGEVAMDVPLDSQFVVVELLRFHLLRDGREGRELVAGAWEIRDAVIPI